MVRETRSRRARFWVGPVVTVATIFAMHSFWARLAPGVSVPGSVVAPVLLAVVVSTFIGGTSSGITSAVLVTVYSAISFDEPTAPGHYEFMGLIRLSLTISCAFASALVVGYLKGRVDSAHSRDVAREREIARAERINAAESRRAAEVLRVNNETLETFVYVITHDLKEPVRAVDFHIAEAERNVALADAKSQLSRAREVNARLAILLQRLLEYSRASLTTPQTRATTIHETLDDAACRAIYEHARIVSNAQLKLQDETVAFVADPTLVSQAIGNLILNAIKHNDSAGPTIQVLARPRGDQVEIIIQDNGPGFPVPIIQRVNHLKRGRPATVAGGFGLVIARRAIERLNGTMSIANLSARGAEVTIRLPMARREASDLGEPMPLQPAASTREIEGSRSIEVTSVASR